MKGSTEVVKGRIQEVAGVLTGNNKLRVLGRAHQAVGHVKLAAEERVRQAKASARKSVNRATMIARDAVDKAKNRS